MSLLNKRYSFLPEKIQSFWSGGTSIPVLFWSGAEETISPATSTRQEETIGQWQTQSAQTAQKTPWVHSLLRGGLMDQTELFLLPHITSAEHISILFRVDFGEDLNLFLLAARDTDLDFCFYNSTAHWTLLVLPCQSRSREALGHKHRNTRQSTKYVFSCPVSI